MLLGAHSQVQPSYVKSAVVSCSALHALQSVTCNNLNSSHLTFYIHCEAVKPLSGQVCTINTQVNT